MTVRVCDDVNEWPPFTYLRSHGEHGASASSSAQEVVGYAVDVLQRILRPKGIAVQIDLLPWVRCLREVESGQMYQMALNASHSAERERQFLLSLPYYDTTHAYFYSRRRFPQGLSIRSPKDLAKHEVCGVHGYNYSAYGLRDEQVDRGALNFSRVIAKLLADRCEVGVEKLEAVQAGRHDGQPLLANPDIAFAPIPGMPKAEFHMLVSRRHPQGQALLDMLNRGIRDLRATGQLKALRQLHQP